MSFFSNFVSKVYSAATFPYAVGPKDESFEGQTIWSLHQGTKKVYTNFVIIKCVDSAAYACSRTQV